MQVLFLIIVLCLLYYIFSNREGFTSGTPFYTLIRNSPQCHTSHTEQDDFGVNPCYTGDYVTNYPFGYPPVDLTKYGAYCPHAQWNTCGGCNQRIWKHF